MSHSVDSAESQREKPAAYSFIPIDKGDTTSELLESRLPRGWPVAPQPLQKSTLGFFGEIALLLLPIAFLGLLPANCQSEMDAEHVQLWLPQPIVSMKNR